MNEADHSDYLFAEAKLGADVEQFLNTDIGRFIVGRANLEVEEATHLFLTCDPERSMEQITKAKRQAIAAQTVITWLNEAVTNGQHSLNALEESGD